LNDRFAEPNNTGFRDINMKIRLPNGHVIELRVEHRAMMNIANLTHDLYKEIQELNRMTSTEGRRLTEKEEFWRRRSLDEIRDIHSHPARQSNLDQFLNERGRSILVSHERKRITPHMNSHEMAERIACLREELQKKLATTAVKQSDFN